MTLSINNDDYEVGSADFLAQALADLTGTEFCEVWLSEPGGPFISCLKNKDRCLLMYLRFEGDGGFTVRNTEEDETKRVDFVLSNGQGDDYPLAWTVSFEAGKQALEYFYVTKAMDSRLTWHAD